MKTQVTGLGSITASKVLTAERALLVQAWEAAPESTLPLWPLLCGLGYIPQPLEGWSED